MLAAETDTTGQVGEYADASRMSHVASGPMYSLNEAPVIVTDAKNPASEIWNKMLQTLRSAPRLMCNPTSYKNLQLKPLFEVHSARCVLDWPVATPQELVKKQQAVKDREQALLALEKQTVDK